MGALSIRVGIEPIGAGDKTLAELRENLSELKIIIIDEMSLVHADLFYKIDARLKEIFKKQNPPVPFGGISVILVGDLLQIPPVKGGDGKGKINYIFSSPKHPKNINAYNVYDNGGKPTDGKVFILFFYCRNSKKNNFNFSFSPIMEIQWIQNDKQSRCIAIYRQMGVEKQ